MRIQLHDQVFGPSPDSDGIVWLITELDGWSSPAVRYSTIDPTYRDGAVQTVGLYGPRALVLSGVVKAPNETLFWAAYNRVLGLCSDLRKPQRLYVDENVRKHVNVVRSGETRLNFIGVGSFDFTMLLTANDPMKYGDEVTTTIASGSTKTIVNNGTAPSSHILLTTTSKGTISVENNTQGSHFHTGAKVLLAGAEADFYKRTLYRRQVNRYAKIHPVSQWWSLDPGPNAIAVYGSASTSIAYRPAWV